MRGSCSGMKTIVTRMIRLLLGVVLFVVACSALALFSLVAMYSDRHSETF